MVGALSGAKRSNEIFPFSPRYVACAAGTIASSAAMARIPKLAFNRAVPIPAPSPEQDKASTQRVRCNAYFPIRSALLPAASVVETLPLPSAARKASV